MSKIEQLQGIEYQGVKVLLSSQLAEVYGVETKQISYNFNYNKDRYKECKHYFALTGDEKKGFLNRHEIQDSSKNAKTLYLWTEKGALLHAKSLGTDQAWETYEQLVDGYYDKKEQLDELTELARRNGFVTFHQFNEHRFSMKRTKGTFRDCAVRDLIGVAEDFCDYVGLLDADTRIIRCESAIKGLKERFNKTGFTEAYRIIVDIMSVQHATVNRMKGQQSRRDKERLIKRINSVLV